jgi:uncharacterized protein involved in exopolysaccharide biosynthesis
MNRLGSRKWLIVGGALVLALSLGAVACGSTSDDQSLARPGMGLNERVQANGGSVGDEGVVARGPAAQRGQAMKERREARADRREALLEGVREKMSAAEQATFDQLTATAKEQHAAVQAARQELAGTLKELRTLVDKYLDLKDSGTN